MLSRLQQIVSASALRGSRFIRGLTNGTTGSQYLPVQSTDFVFARVGEELGFLGGALVLVLFALNEKDGPHREAEVGVSHGACAKRRPACHIQGEAGLREDP